MTIGRCREVESSIGRPVHALSEAERLVLEQHLASCAACRQQSELTRTITELVTSAPSGLSAQARERAISAAFAPRARKGRSQRPVARRGLQIGLSLVAALALLISLRLVPGKEPKSAERARSQRERESSSETSVAAAARQPESPPASETAVAPRPPEQPIPAANGPWIEVARAEKRTFAHAQVALSAHARVRFDRTGSALELARGRIDVDVDEKQGAAFAVVTQNFRVHVLGTQFVVTPERVAVVRGKVQVTTLDGTKLKALRAGQSYRYRAPKAAQRADAPSEVAADEGPSSAELLRAARASLARGDVAGARATLQQVDPRASSLTERAEADTLRAECALLAREPDEAIAAYLVVAERYTALPAAQNALFAAAQLRERKQDTSGARALFERYLASYPQGRFADEARARLAKLAP